MGVVPPLPWRQHHQAMGLRRLSSDRCEHFLADGAVLARAQSEADRHADDGDEGEAQADERVDAALADAEGGQAEFRTRKVFSAGAAQTVPMNAMSIQRTATKCQMAAVRTTPWRGLEVK